MGAWTANYGIYRGNICSLLIENVNFVDHKFIWYLNVGQNWVWTIPIFILSQPNPGPEAHWKIYVQGGKFVSFESIKEPDCHIGIMKTGHLKPAAATERDREGQFTVNLLVSIKSHTIYSVTEKVLILQRGDHHTLLTHPLSSHSVFEIQY